MLKQPVAPGNIELQSRMPVLKENKSDTDITITIRNTGTDRSEQTVQTQQSDLGLHCLPLLHCKTVCHYCITLFATTALCKLFTTTALYKLFASTVFNCLPLLGCISCLLLLHCQKLFAATGL